jgi:hypothetical protein
MRFACRVTKAAVQTHSSEYEMLPAFLLQLLSRESASVLSYTYIACLVIKYHDHMLKRASFYAVKHVTVTHTSIQVVLNRKA